MAFTCTRQVAEFGAARIETIQTVARADYDAIVSLGHMIDMPFRKVDAFEGIGSAVIAAKTAIGAHPHAVAAIYKHFQHKIVRKRCVIGRVVEIAPESIAVIACETVAGTDPQTPLGIESHRLYLLMRQPVDRFIMSELIGVRHIGASGKKCQTTEK